MLEGDGVVKDFPGNYTEYHQWKEEIEEQQKREAEARKTNEKPAQANKPVNRKPEKLTFKEKKEFEALTAEIDELNAEREALENEFNSGEAVADIEAKSKRYTVVKDLLDEKEMRWLELSEKS